MVNKQLNHTLFSFLEADRTYAGAPEDFVEYLEEAGFVIVPKEPTEAMIDAGIMPPGNRTSPFVGYPNERRADCADVYRTMVKAAETQP